MNVVFGCFSTLIVRSGLCSQASALCCPRDRPSFHPRFIKRLKYCFRSNFELEEAINRIVHKNSNIHNNNMNEFAAQGPNCCFINDTNMKGGGGLAFRYDPPHLAIHSKNVLHSINASMSALHVTAPLNSFLNLKLVSD
jgi:hypothetical protein